MLRKRVQELDEKMDRLLQFLPKFYGQLTKERRVYPCEKFKNEFCSSCENGSCRYNPSYKNDKDADDIMNDFINGIY